VKAIQLINGGAALVDDEDFSKVFRYNWRQTGGYATTRHKGKQILLHHLVAGRHEGYVVDHINRNRLDNQKANLRHVTQQQNSLNRLHKNKTGFRGVQQIGAGKYVATASGKNLGTFDNPMTAAKVYNWAAQYLYGEFAILNLDLAGEPYPPHPPAGEIAQAIYRIKPAIARAPGQMQAPPYAKRRSKRKTNARENYYVIIRNEWHYRRRFRGKRIDENLHTNNFEEAKKTAKPIEQRLHEVARKRNASRINNGDRAIARARTAWEKHQNAHNKQMFYAITICLLARQTGL